MSSHSPHIFSDFDQAISSLRGEVLTMAGKARHNLERANRSLLERNKEMANAVIAEDDEVDEHERQIDKVGMDILARFHPMASDLRLVVSSMKVSANLERVADHASSIAKRARKICAGAELKDATLVEPVYTLAQQILTDSITSYRDRDAVLAASLHQRDKELDRLYKQAAATFSARIEERAGNSQDYLHLILVVRSLERVGDLAVNIGEDVVFAEESLDLRHTKERVIG